MSENDTVSEMEPTATIVADTQIVFENPVIRVEHGSTCQSATGEPLAIELQADLPSFATQAIVFLNGWSLEYPVDEHHIWAAGAYFKESRIEDDALIWEARGLLVDDGQDDEYSICCHYTILSWDGRSIDLNTDHRDIHNMVNGSNRDLPLVSVPSYAQADGVGLTRLALPRGFMMTQGSLDDQHVWQIGYDLGPGEHFVRHERGYGILPPPPLPNPASRVDGEYLSWETRGLFQDDKRRGFLFFVWHTMLSGGGGDLDIVQPPFTLRPSVRSPNIGSGMAGEATHHVAIENMPFDFAVPILTGWRLEYEFGDDDVHKMGVWVSNFEFDRPPSRATGTLHYDVVSVLRDEGTTQGYFFDHNVHILGLNL